MKGRYPEEKTDARPASIAYDDPSADGEGRLGLRETARPWRSGPGSAQMHNAAFLAAEDGRRCSLGDVDHERWPSSASA